LILRDTAKSVQRARLSAHQEHESAGTPSTGGKQIGITGGRALPRGPDGKSELRGTGEARNRRNFDEGIGSAETGGGTERAGGPLDIGEVGFEGVGRTVDGRCPRTVIQRQPKQQCRIGRLRGVKGNMKDKENIKQQYTTVHTTPQVNNMRL
jgi:hypothetical protein